MTNFKYDIVTLIELVESKPCIWDKTNEHNKNKILRDKSWQEIFLFLEDEYEELSQAEKKKIGDNIIAKWSNIRDSFLRSLRTKSGQGVKRSYIYSEHLQFLLKIVQKADTGCNFSQVGTEDDSIGVEDLTDSQPLNTSARSQPKSTSQALPTLLSNRSTSPENHTRSKRQLDDSERDILSQLKKGKHSDEPCSSHSRSDHEMLLLSFVPYIRDMNETELMDLQMEVLATIKRIKRQRVATQNSFQPQLVAISQSSPALTHSNSYQSSLQSLEYQSPPPLNQLEQQERRISAMIQDALLNTITNIVAVDSKGMSSDSSGQQQGVDVDRMGEVKMEFEAESTLGESFTMVGEEVKRDEKSK